MDWAGLALIIGPGALLSGGFLWWAARIDRALIASQDWPSAEAVIEASAVSDQNVPSVSYRFTVEDTTYVGRRLSFLPGALPAGEAAQFTTRYPVGATVICYYPPDGPIYAVLSRTGNVRNLRRAAYAIAGVFGLVFILVVLKSL